MDETTYIIAVRCVDGGEVFGFTDPVDATNFIMDIQDHVLEMAMAIEGE
jgi:hypothetical protein